MAERTKGRQNQDTEGTPEKYITPNLDGEIDKVKIGDRGKSRWVVSTPVPSIDFAILPTSELPENLRPQRGLRVTYDLETVVTGGDENRHYARDVRRYQQAERQKPTPKNRR